MEHKPIRKKQRKYDADFKKEVLKMIESDGPVPKVARVLRHWQQADLLLEKAVT